MASVASRTAAHLWAAPERHPAGRWTRVKAHPRPEEEQMKAEVTVIASYLLTAILVLAAIAAV